MARVWWHFLLIATVPACAVTVTTTPEEDASVDADAAGETDVAPALDGAAEHVLDASGARDVFVEPDDVSTFPQTSAEAVCAALFRCCGGEARQQYFSALQWNDRVPPELTRELPPTDEETCRRVLAEVLRRAVFPDWIDAVDRRQVVYEVEGSLACRRPLLEASCGSPALVDALFNPTCFSLYESGTLGRRMFRRAAREGEACRTIRESPNPIAFYGSCASSTAFCCVPDPRDSSRCLGFFESNPLGLTDGRCRHTAAPGAACTSGSFSLGGSVQLCARDLVCGLASHVCLTTDYDTRLSVGDRCYDAFEGRSLGRCPDHESCDLFRLMDEGTATHTCIALLDDGAACAQNIACNSYNCVDGICHASARFCAAP